MGCDPFHYPSGTFLWCNGFICHFHFFRMNRNTEISKNLYNIRLTNVVVTVK